jgi:hypothetical protein
VWLGWTLSDIGSRASLSRSDKTTQTVTLDLVKVGAGWRIAEMTD